MKKLVIAGGTGMIGSALTELAKSKGYMVFILTRKPTADHHIFWNPENKAIDLDRLQGTHYIVNLTGENIAEKRWTDDRKIQLLNSRIQPNQFLAELVSAIPSLEHVVCASGINCYGFDSGEPIHVESDQFGEDYLSQLVKAWEESTQVISVGLTNLRISVVLSDKGGALAKMMYPMKMGLGSAIGSGKQWMSWIHITDLAELIMFACEQKVVGPVNAVAGNSTNQDFMRALAGVTRLPFWMPNVPSFIMQTLYGEMSDILLKGARSSNELIQSRGYKFKYPTLQEAFGALSL